MDGLLIDSEPFWRTAEISVFSSLGIDFNEDMCRETVGMRIDEVVVYWNEKLLLNMPISKTANNIVDELIALVQKDGKALPSVNSTLETLTLNKRKIALASSSSMRIIEAVVDKLSIRSYFQVLHSAEYEEFGKPHPAVFLSTAKLLKSKPSDCIVYEDSRNGMKAGLAAGMKTIIIPEFPEPHMEWHDEADAKWHSLEEFNLSVENNPN
jgi:sugar-phosphatase